MKIKTLSYTGNGVDGRGITGAGFQPDVVIVKREGFLSGGYAVIRTSTMAGDNAKPSDGKLGLTANLVQGLDADGFTVGDAGQVNASGAVYHALCLQAHASDLKVGSYTGNGADSRSIAGVGFQPDTVIVMAADTSDDPVFSTSVHSADDSSYFNTTTAGGTDRIQAMETDGFQVGTHASVNANGVTYHYIALKNVAGSFKALSYTGNGVDNRSITGVGFQPDDVVAKRVSGFDQQHAPWHPTTIGDATDSSLTWSSTGATANLVQALEADGFQVGNDATVNANGQTYVAMAWLDGDSQAGGGQNIVKLQGETEEVSEALAQTLALGRFVNETLELAEAVQRNVGLLRLVLEDEQVSEAVSAVTGLLRASGETVEVYEALNTVLGKAQQAVETLQMAESLLAVRSLSRTVNETLSILDSEVSARAIVSLLAETVQLAEDVARRASLVRFIIETSEISEGLVRVLPEVLTPTVTLSQRSRSSSLSVGERALQAGNELPAAFPVYMGNYVLLTLPVRSLSLTLEARQ